MVYIILGKGFEEIEAIAPCDILRRGGVQVQFAGIDGLEITGSNGITVKADIPVEEMDLKNVEMIVLPGGLRGVNAIRNSEVAMNAVQTAYAAGKYVAAICAAPTILADLGYTNAKQVTVYPDMRSQMGPAALKDAPVASDCTILTGRAAGAALDFGYLLLEKLKGAEVAEKIRTAMVY